MSSNQILKRSIIGGFRKEGVLDYIEQLQLEIQRLKTEIAEKNSVIGDLEEFEALCEERKAENNALSDEINSLKAEIETVKGEKAKLIADSEVLESEKISLSAVIETVRNEKSEVESALQNSELEKKAAETAHIAEIEKVKAEAEANYKAELEKVSSEHDAVIEGYKAKISAFEDKLASLEELYGKAEDCKAAIVAAEEKADRIRTETAKAAEDSFAQVSQANERIKTARINYEASATMLQASVDNLMAVLDSVAQGE